MSYCRWSSDNFRCDLYCYEDVAGGFTTHVAGARYVGELPQVPALGSTSAQEWVSARRKQSAYLSSAQSEPIGLAHDGKTFSDPTPESLLRRMLALREVGYHVPDFAIEAVREECSPSPTQEA